MAEPRDQSSGTDEALRHPELDTRIPHSARMYDYYLGGKAHYAADRDAAEKVLSVNPGMLTTIRQNRAFMRRCIHHLAAERGVRQFLDIGTGLPTSPNVHEVAQAVDPAARIVYVDNDPIVLAHARALLDSAPQGRTAYIDADMRDPGSVLEAVEMYDTLDPTQPMALTIIGMFHFVTDEMGAQDILERYKQALPPGSYLGLSHGTADVMSEKQEAAAEAYRRQGIPTQHRTRAQFEAFFDGWKLLDPGVVFAQQWHPEPHEVGQVGDEEVGLYVGVARKPE